MGWIILAIILVVCFVVYRKVYLLIIEKNIARARRDKIFKKTWAQIAFYEPSVPMKMAFSEVFSKGAYRKNFDTHFNLFIKYALDADERLDARVVQMYSEQLMENLPAISGMSLDMDADTTVGSGFPNESGVFLSATLYALIVTQDKGANIRQKLMLGENNHAGNDMYLQKKTDREYFEFMNKEHSNFCKLVGIIEPHKSTQIEIVAGYLIMDS
jgi:hypothetical protein